MKRTGPTPYGSPAPRQPPSIAGMLGMIGIFAGILIILSYPIISTAAIATGLITGLGIRRYLTKRAANGTSEQKLRIPGLGTLELRLTPHTR